MLDHLCKVRLCLYFLSGRNFSLSKSVRTEKADTSVHVQLTVYTALLALGSYALYDQPWTYNSSALWEGWPNQSIP